MIGVLEMRAGENINFFFATSGARSPAECFKRVAKVLGMSVIENILNKKTAGRANINHERLKASNVEQVANAKFFECAAPKLIGHITNNKEIRKEIRNGEINWSMTEMWCGPSETHINGKVYGPCGNCKQILPMMLCFLEPIPPTKDSQGFVQVVSKNAKNRMRAGIETTPRLSAQMNKKKG